MKSWWWNKNAFLLKELKIKFYFNIKTKQLVEFVEFSLLKKLLVIQKFKKLLKLHPFWLKFAQKNSLNSELPPLEFS